MKKTVLVFACLATIVFTSCKGKQDNAAVEPQKENTEEVQATEAESNVPEFDNEELGEYIKLYDAYIKDYEEAVKSKDMTKFQELSTKGQELATKGQELSTSGLSESDMQKLQEYMTQSAQELQELSQEMMK